jgi:hypothetical protein
MTLLRISIPVYKRNNSWANLSEQGIIEVSTDSGSDTLSESYEKLKPEIEDLFLKMQAECQIVLDLH